MTSKGAEDNVRINLYYVITRAYGEACVDWAYFFRLTRSGRRRTFVEVQSAQRSSVFCALQNGLLGFQISAHDHYPLTVFTELYGPPRTSPSTRHQQHQYRGGYFRFGTHSLSTTCLRSRDPTWSPSACCSCQGHPRPGLHQSLR